MKVELVLKNGKHRKFSPQLAKFLVARGVGTELQPQIYMTRQLTAEPVTEAPADKPKRKYVRRDMKAEE